MKQKANKRFDLKRQKITQCEFEMKKLRGKKKSINIFLPG